jgi:hypothetical protein
LSIQLRSARAPRPAPPGHGPRRLHAGGPPDGWVQFHPPRRDRIGIHVDRLLLRAVAGSRPITRREFTRRLGQAGLVIGLGASGVIWRAAPGRTIPGPCDPDGLCGPMENGCGPSELCPASTCRPDPDDNGQNCDLSKPDVRNRVNPSTHAWEGFSCGNNSDENCWRECCQHNLKRCCDCCIGHQYSCPSCNACNDCGTKDRCICRSDLDNACPPPCG